MANVTTGPAEITGSTKELTNSTPTKELTTPSLSFQNGPVLELIMLLVGCMI
jgi:hypothetical protein